MARIQKRWVISDIHGCGRQFLQLLDHIDPNPEEMVILGDLCNRGLDTWGVFQEVAQLIDEGCHVVMGNHDFALMQYRLGVCSEEEFTSLEVGGITTKKSFQIAAQKFGEKHVNDVIDKVIHSMVLYYEDKRHIFVHAGIDPRIPFLSQQNREVLLNGCREWKNPTIEHCYEQTIVFGHTPTPYIHKMIQEDDARIWMNKRTRKMAVDTGAGFGWRLTMADLMEGVAYAYDFEKRKIIEYRYKKKETW